MTSAPSKICWRETRVHSKERGITVSPAGRRVEIAWHREFIRDFDLWLILEGRAELFFEDGSTHQVGRGSAIWLRPEVPFGLRNLEGASLHAVWSHFDLLDPDGAVLPSASVSVPHITREIGNIQFFEGAFRHLAALPYHRSPAERSSDEQRLQQSEADALLLALLCEYELAGMKEPELAQAPPRYRQVVEAVQAWLDHHPDRPVTAGDLARQYGYSLPHFSRIFRKTLGRSPTELIIDARVKQAKRLLLDSTLNVSEVAASLGYEEVFYFSKQFKKVTGLSPLAFRKLHQDRSRE